MGEKEFLLTQEGYDNLEKELERLKTVERYEIADRIKVALGFGDLSENSEYDEAKNAQASNEIKIAELEESMEKYKNLESTLNNTLIMAQSTADEIKKVAQQQADQIIQDAQGSAKQRSKELEQEIIIKTKELDDLQKQFDVYKAKMESLLISQLELIKDVNVVLEV